MADLQDLLVRIDATTEQLRRELKRAETATASATAKIEKDVAKVDSRFDKLGASAKRMTGALAGAFGAQALGSKLIEVARQTDILDAQLETVTGSAEAGAAAFKELERIAAETPFALDQVVSAFVKLKARALDPSREAIMAYGNTAAAMGKSLDQLIEAVADATTGQFQRMLDFGIKAEKQGGKVRISFQGVTTEVNNSAREIEGYLRRLGEVNFAGAMERRAQSLDGALSNLGDAWDGLFRTIARGPVGAFIESEVRKGITALNNLSNTVSALQGTSTPEQDLSVRMAELESLRESLVFNISKAPLGSPYFEALAGQLEDVQSRIAFVYDRMQMLRKTTDKPASDGGGSSGGANSFEDVAKAIKKSGIEDSFDRNIKDESETLKAWASSAEEVQRLFETTRTETEQIHAQIARVQELAAQGFFRDAGVDDQQIIERLNQQLEDIEDKTNELSEFGKEAAQSIQRAFADFLFDPFSDGLDGMLGNFLQVIQRMVAEVASQQILKGLFGGFAGSTNPFLAGLASFAGARAMGGPVAPGKTYLVGERGPELFKPNVGGQIVANGGGGVTSIVVDQRGAGAPPVQQSRQMVNGRLILKTLIRDEIGSAFADGSIDRMFAGASMPVRRTGRR